MSLNSREVFNPKRERGRTEKGEGSREYEKATVYLTYQKRKGLMEDLYKNKPGLLHVSHYATVLSKSSQKIHAMLISALIMHVWLV